MWGIPRIMRCTSKDEIIFVTAEEHSKPLSEECTWMSSLGLFKQPTGPRFADGSINWQCSCMAGGSLVAHRCGHLFRPLYVCMSADGEQDVTTRCPEEFVNWVACMQNLSEERMLQMKARFTANDDTEA